jgi:hypothetical protein
MTAQEIIELFDKYQLIDVLVGFLVYVAINKRIQVVDKAVNQRPQGSMTISEEVTQINHKLDQFTLELNHVKKQVDEHRKIDEQSFLRIEKDIRILASKV